MTLNSAARSYRVTKEASPQHILMLYYLLLQNSISQFSNATLSCASYFLVYLEVWVETNKDQSID